MQVNISSKNMDLTEAIEEYAKKKIEKLPRFFDRITEVDLIIEKVKNTYQIEVIANVVQHDPFVAKSDHDDLYACIDLCIDRSIRQLKDHKSKLRDNKHNMPIGGNENP